MEETKVYVDMTSTLEILKMDSDILPKPNDIWNTFIPHDGDIAHVDEDDSDYVFEKEDWVKIK